MDYRNLYDGTDRYPVIRTSHIKKYHNIVRLNIFPSYRHTKNRLHNDTADSSTKHERTEEGEDQISWQASCTGQEDKSDGGARSRHHPYSPPANKRRDG